ncbi:hypothetical protein Acsp04_23730 [Actinomadura sp. NBRC 104425]|uniref:hypothetical protein n=1 Tax=Actinomadura sp. NBRC 104425 TaxID=3032204 RepID=UPI0024A00B26|nr:hypothetical protein [Actinomadura sp. NBRC 104425]GLZ12138.1 hypothetical protein Acsp04_23730 [Actinomadura sp. NBRC 104425]
MEPGTDDDTAQPLCRLGEALGKYGVPVWLRVGDQGEHILRASHPRAPLSTDVHLQSINGQVCFLSEWGSVICAAENIAEAVAYVVRLLGLRDS